MSDRTEAEERALVEKFAPKIVGPSTSLWTEEREQECKVALRPVVFQILQWGLEDQPDVDDAFDKIWVAAVDAGWMPGEIDEAIERLRGRYERMITSETADDDENCSAEPDEPDAQ